MDIGLATRLQGWRSAEFRGVSSRRELELVSTQRFGSGAQAHHLKRAERATVAAT